jgi:CheY-like chemotaxis protein
MDCQMPVMDGYEATIAIRKWEQSRGVHTPIIAMTANAFRKTKEKCFDSGMDGFVTKPFTQDDLEAAIKRQAGQRSKAS